MTDPATALAEALAHLAAGALAEARLAIGAVEAGAPGHPAVPALRGVIALQEGRPAEAVDAFRAALAIAPNDAGLHGNLGVALHVLGRHAESDAAFRAGLGAGGGAGMALRWGHARLGRGDVRAALAAFRFGTVLAPDDDAPWREAAFAAQEAGDAPAAFAASGRAATIDPDDTLALTYRGHAALDLGRPREAAAALERAFAVRALGRARQEPATPAAAGVRKLVMGLATGYDRAALAPFVETLRGSGYEGEIVLLTADLDPATIVWLRRRGVALRSVEGIRDLPCDPQLMRHYAYTDYLAQRRLDDPAGVPTRILLTDVRDVIFQADPLADPLPGSVAYVLEPPGVTFAGSAPNRLWMNRTLGPADCAFLRPRRVSCGGTVFGDHDGIIAHLAAVRRLTLHLDPAVRFLKGVDQIHHNLTVYRHPPPGAVLVENGVLVETLNETTAPGIVIGPDEILRGPDGRACPVVHQYDRFPALVAAVERRTARLAARNDATVLA